MTANQGSMPSGYVLNAPHVRWPSGTDELTYSFAEGSVDADRDGHFTTPLSAGHRSIVREAMDAWEQVCGVRFREVADSADANIRIGGAEIDGPYNVAGYSQFVFGMGSFGTTLKNIIAIDTADWSERVRLYDIALHELGHAMGIEHSDLPNQVMSGNRPGTTPYYDQPGRDVLQPDDIAAARALWGTTIRSVPAHCWHRRCGYATRR